MAISAAPRRSVRASSTPNSGRNWGHRHHAADLLQAQLRRQGGHRTCEHAELVIASSKDIDSTACTSLGHPLGPFELMDPVGFGVIAFIARARFARTAAPEGALNPGIPVMVAEGRLGRKAGSGFCDRGA